MQSLSPDQVVLLWMVCVTTNVHTRCAPVTRGAKFWMQSFDCVFFSRIPYVAENLIE